MVALKCEHKKAATLICCEQTVAHQHINPQSHPVEIVHNCVSCGLCAREEHLHRFQSPSPFLQLSCEFYMTNLDLDRIECLIFDLDGTLVDSEILCLQGYCDTVPDLDWDAHYIAKHFRGWKLNLIVEAIEKHIGRTLPDNFEEIYRARVAELFEDQLKPFDGVLELVASLDRPKCIASAGPIKKMRHSLGLTGLLPYFDPHLFSSYVIQSWKPEPDLFLHAAKTMGFEPDACLVIEDSPVGIEAARRAGMQHLLHCPAGHDAPADYHGAVLTSYHAFPLKD